MLLAQSWDRTSGRMVLIALDAATWIYVVVVAHRALLRLSRLGRRLLLG